MEKAKRASAGEAMRATPPPNMAVIANVSGQKIASLIGDKNNPSAHQKRSESMSQLFSKMTSAKASDPEVRSLFMK